MDKFIEFLQMYILSKQYLSIEVENKIITCFDKLGGYTIFNDFSSALKNSSVYEGLGQELDEELRQFEEKEVYPVVCAVLYWGKGHWKSPYSIKELLQKKLTDNSVKAAENYIDDIRLQVFEMTHLPQEIRKRFQSDMRVVVDYLAGGKNYKPGHRILKHPEAFLQMIYALTGDLRYEELMTL